MSYVDTITATLSVHPSGNAGTAYAYLNDVANAYTDENSDTYATIGLKTGSSAVTTVYFTFDTSAIPANATIISVACSAKGYISTTTSSRVASRTMQMCANTTAKGSGAQLSTTATVRNLTVGTWTRTELNNARLRFYAKRGTSNTSTDYYMRCYGATLTVEYSYEGTFYTITASSSASAATVAPATQDVESGKQGVVTISGNITNVTVKDNGADVTASLVTQGNDYLYYINNISADHVITLTEAIVVTVPFRVKMNGTWVTPTKVLAKSGGSWHEVSKVFYKDGGGWTS